MCLFTTCRSVFTNCSTENSSNLIYNHVHIAGPVPVTVLCNATILQPLPNAADCLNEMDEIGSEMIVHGRHAGADLRRVGLYVDKRYFLDLV